LTIVFHPLAERELIEAAKFYETRAAGLGADFVLRWNARWPELSKIPKREHSHTCNKAKADSAFPFRPPISIGGDATDNGHLPDAFAAAAKLLEAPD
jgi:hypothetical protein